MPEPVKPPALLPGSAVRIVAPASPVDAAKLRQGCEELTRLGYEPRWGSPVLGRNGYFAGSAAARLADLKEALADHETHALFAARGGYGTGYLLERLDADARFYPRIVLGYSDITLLEILLWQKHRWVTFYGPMVAAGLDAGPGRVGGYEPVSFQRALTKTHSGWSLDLQGAALSSGTVEGVLLGGCLTLVETLLGTPWELDTRGAILLLEDRGMKPYQVDRMLLHLRHADKFKEVRGVVLGDFPACEPSEAGSATVREVCERLLEPFGMPVVYGVPFGHTSRPILTLPLGVRARLSAEGAGQLEILEPAVTR